MTQQHALSAPSALSILQELVALKDHKDHFGKDAHYEQNQPLAWERARAFLNAGDKDPVTLDLSMLVQRLARALRRMAPGDPLSDEAVRFLDRNGLTGSPLRGTAGVTSVTGGSRP